jgi:carbon starvation protein
MNSLWVVLIGGVIIYLAYNFYAKRIDKTIIQPDPERATPARMYMDGADFMPTSRFVLYGYHFKSIAAAGPIVGVILATAIWGWFPAIVWLMVGVSFIGWASDYTAIMMAVRNDGNSMSAVAHRLISPRVRTMLFVFIFFYLLLVAGAFVGILSGILAARPDVPFGILVLAILGFVGGYMIYRAKTNLLIVTVIVVGGTLLAMALGPVGADLETAPADWSKGPVSGAVLNVNEALDGEGATIDDALYQVEDPTLADPRITRDPATGEPLESKTFDPATGGIGVFPSFILWGIFLLVFSYLGANLPIWRFAQPVNYIGFWVTALTIGLSAVGAVLAPFTASEVAKFEVEAFNGFAPAQANAAIMPLWPMLFVTIACGAISGWHALFGSVGTARQLEYETDALPVGGGGMFSENTLGLLSLVAVAITGLRGASAFAGGVGELLHEATFGALDVQFGTALGFGAFVVIVLTVVQLVFRVMRVTLGEWLGNRWVGFKNQHIASIIGSVVVLALVLSGTWVYLWFLFGASNQLMAALSLMIVTVWLASAGRNPTFTAIPTVFMYVTTMVAILVTAYNLYKTVAVAEGIAAISVLGAWAMLIVAVLLFVAAIVIAMDGWKAWSRNRAAPVEPAPVPGT